MMRWQWMVAAVTLVAAGLAEPVAAQPVPTTQVTVANGIELELSMNGVASASGVLQSHAQVRDGELYRLVVDRDGYARFAYAIRLEPRASGVEVMFRPIRLHEALSAFRPQGPTFVLPFRLDDTLATLPRIQRSGVVGPGDAITLDLFQHRDTGQRVGDVVRVLAVSDEAVAKLATYRMQRRENRPVLTVAGMTIRRAGEVLTAGKPGGFATGHVVGLSLGDDIAVAFSAEPPQEEVPYGVATVDGHVIRFVLDGVEYECEGTEPVGPSGLSAVWMYVVPGPFPYANGFFSMAGNDIESLMRISRRR